MKNISLIVPTLNSEKYIEKLLKSISNQKNINPEILICDGGSSDKTIEISKKYNVKIINNKLKTAEAGKKVGINNSSNDFIAFLDSDNQIIDQNYLFESLEILENNKNITLVEPLGFYYDKNDTLINKYCSIIGCNDPLDVYLNKYDKISYYKNNILGIDYKLLKEDKTKIIYEINQTKVFPTYGANGTVINKKKLLVDSKSDFYFDNDEIFKIYTKNNNKLIICKHKSKIAHYYCSNLNIFIKKQKRRIKDYIYFNNYRKVSNNNFYIKYKLLILLIKSAIILPIILDTLFMYKNSKKKEVFIHPILLYTTLFIYIGNTILGKVDKKLVKLSRDNW